MRKMSTSGPSPHEIAEKASRGEGILFLDSWLRTSISQIQQGEALNS